MRGTVRSAVAVVAWVAGWGGAGSTLAGCGSYWDLRKGESIELGCAGQLDYYPDADGDLWGDPGSIPTQSCTPDPENLLTASNALDCDDSDPGITGRAGTICPSEMAGLFGGSPCVDGKQEGNSEFVATCGESPIVGYREARTDCENWAGWDTSQPVGVAVPNRGLAALETEPEYNALSAWLVEQSAGAPIAVWIDLRWEGSVTAGAWVWPDGTSPTYIPPCGGVEATPGMFYPDLVPGIEEADATLSEELDALRSALVFDGASWCRGIPTAGGPAFSTRGAHALCERPRPDLAEYAEVPADGATPGVGQ
ncbi:MAG: hypothetical protein ABMB14_19540 [Myxococcota bacterium]